MKETKSERFVRIAEKRTNKVLEELRKLGKCADRRTYDYTPEQVQQIFAAVLEATGKARSQYEFPAGRRRFSLSDPEPEDSSPEEEILNNCPNCHAITYGDEGWSRAGKYDDSRVCNVCGTVMKRYSAGWLTDYWIQNEEAQHRQWVLDNE